MKRLSFSLLLVLLSAIISAQKTDSTKAFINTFSSIVTLQSKGISTIPNLTLGKPAAVFDLKIGRKLTFEPQFRFALDGKPWAMVFWWRYNLAFSKKFRMILSTNYSFAYKTITDSSSGEVRDIIRTTRYLVASAEPNYQVNKYLDIGVFLFYNYGIEKYITRNTYMVSLRPGISNIPITKNIAVRVVPEVYYLRMDDNDGWFLNARLSINKRNFPLSVSALLNYAIRSNIKADYTTLWNIAVSYTINKKFIEAR